MSLKVEISGPAGTGKTALMQLIQRTLEENGFQHVTLSGYDEDPFVITHDLHSYASRVAAFKKRNPRIDLIEKH